MKPLRHISRCTCPNNPVCALNSHSPSLSVGTRDICLATAVTKRRGGWTGQWGFRCCARTPVFLKKPPKPRNTQEKSWHMLLWYLPASSNKNPSFPSRKDSPLSTKKPIFSHFLLIFTQNFVPPPQLLWPLQLETTGGETSDRQNTEPKYRKTRVCSKWPSLRFGSDMSLWGPQLRSWGPPSLGSRLVSPTSPQVSVPGQWEVFCGVDALGTLLGPVTGLPGNAGLCGRGGSSQTIYTSNIKQVCCPTALKPFEVHQVLQVPYFAEYRSTFPCFSRSSRRGNDKGSWTQQPVQVPEVTCGQRE